MRRAAAVATATLVLAVTGCSADGSPAEPLVIDGGSPSATPSPTASADASEDPGSARGEFDENGHDVHPGRLRARGEESRAVADAWLAYWEVRLAAFYQVRVDPTGLGAVATGEAADQVIAYVSGLEQRRQRTEGDLVINVDQVRLRGDRATVRGCAQNAGADRRADGTAAEPVIPFYRVRGELVREGGAWRVSTVAAAETPPC